MRTVLGEQVILVEASSLKDYETMHLPGALHLPSDQVEAQANRQLPNLWTQVVVYSNDSFQSAAHQVLRALKQLGYTNLFYYPGGKQDWIEAGFPVEGTQFPPGTVLRRNPFFYSAA